jgi:hypothetical protein
MNTGGGCGLLVSFITVLSANEIKGTISGEAQTAAAKRPPSTNDLCMLDKPALRSGKNINPHLQSTALNVEFGKSIVSASPSLNSITSCKPNEIALCLAIDNICGDISVAST